MHTGRPTIAKINLVCRHFDESLNFYRLLGVDLPEPTAQPPGALHVEANQRGTEFALDNETLARIYNAGRRTSDGAGSSLVLTAFVASRADVDAACTRLAAAGHHVRQPPYDAFWGARFAIVRDPEGNDVGLMSPIDSASAYWPPVDSPEV